MGKRVIVTGGSGLAGKWVVKELFEQGYEVLNLDKVPLDHPHVRTLITDLTDAGQVFNALASPTIDKSYHDSIAAQPIDAIIHLAAIPQILTYPDNEVYRINVMSTYNILDAATKYNIPKVILASSETTYGTCFADEHRDPDYFPLDEEYNINPMDSYATSKVVNEVTAKAFQTRTGIDVYCFRIANVIDPSKYVDFPAYFADPIQRKRITWSYIDTRDLAQACRLAVETDGLGFQVMNIAADDVSSDRPTQELLDAYYPNVPLKKELGEFETLVSNNKVKRLLGFEQQHYWRSYVDTE
jgi:nucleoside-diphosphate-sugar epimerase